MNRSPSTNDTPAESGSPALSRNELLTALVLFLIGVSVRVAFPSAMAVEHFDEGVYASNLWCPDTGFQYPDRHLYAPALLPALIEWSLMLFGPTRWAPMVPSLIFGSLTVPLIWWVGRSWFGQAAGLSAAALAALSDYHILFSRSALTDVTLGFWLLLAVYFFEAAFRTLCPARAVIAGVVTGLAWWTKYNGWLPLAIGLSGLLAWSLFAPREERKLGRRLLLWSFATITALAVWSPFWWSLPHGYGEVAANHRGYVVGLAGWVSSFERHRENLRFFDGRITGLGLGAVLVIISRTVSKEMRCARLEAELLGETPLSDAQTARSHSGLEIVWLALGLTIAFGLGVMFVGTIGLAAFVSFMAVIPMFHFLPGTWHRRDLTRSSLLSTMFSFDFDRKAWMMGLETPEAARQFICKTRQALVTHQALWLTLAWWFGLLVTAPLYRPFPRLMLSWIIAGWFLVSLDWSLAIRLKDWLRLSAFIGGACHERDTARRLQVQIFGVMTFLMLFLFTPPVWRKMKTPAWQQRTSLIAIADQIQNVVRQRNVLDQQPAEIGGKRAVLYVFAEPGLFFHLPADDLGVAAAGSLDFLKPDARSTGLPTFLVTGPHAHRSAAFEEQVTKHAARIELVQRWPYAASDFVLLDQVSPSQLDAERVKCEVRLYRVK